MPTHTLSRKPRTTYPPILPGARYGSLTILTAAPPNKWDQAMWNCRCDCGTTWTVRGTDISNGVIHRCKPCGRKSTGVKNTGKISPNRHDLTGRLFGKITVLRPAPSKLKRAFWWCRCSCGQEFECKAHTLVHDRKKSCGCTRYARESNPKEPKPPRVRVYVPKPKIEKPVSPWAHNTSTDAVFPAPVPPVQAADNRTALIVASRLSHTPWADVAEMTDLTIEECKARFAEATNPTPV